MTRQAVFEDAGVYDAGGSPLPIGSSLTWQGAWSGATAYVIGDAVSLSGSSYVCILAHTNHTPPNGTYWNVLAAAGATGATGSTGSTGSTGATGSAGAAGPNTVTAATTTNLTGLLKGDGANVGTAAAGTDYVAPAGNAATATALATSRNIDGQAFNGTAAITVIAPGTHAATGKTTPIDADEVPLVDSAASNVLKKVTWANIKATLKAYTDTLYPAGSGTSTGTNTGDQTVPGFATNAVLLDSAAAAGAASTVMRSNDTIAAFDTTAPSTQAFGDAAAVGTAAFAARRDHKHAMPNPWLPFRSGGTFFYSPNFGATANSAFAQSTMFAMPFYVPVSTTFTKITAVCVTGAASSSVRLGIYSDTSGKPDALVVDAGTVATTSSSINATITFGVAQTLAPGWYWLACVSQGGAATLQGCSGNNVNQVANVPTTNPFSNGPMHGYSQASVTGALPSPWGATATQQQALPIVWLTPQ